MARTFSKHRRIAFTLVELLVVIGIVAVLIALLVPALSKARAISQRTSCLNQMRQIAFAAQMYAQDNAGWVCPAEWTMTKPWSITAPHSSGYFRPCPYVDANNTASAFPSDTMLLGKYTNGNLSDIYTRQQVNGRVPTLAHTWRCPSSPITRPSGVGFIVTYAPDAGSLPYIEINNGFKRMWRFAGAKAPSKLLLFIESSSEQFNPGKTDPPSYTGNVGGTWTITGPGSIGMPGSSLNHAVNHGDYTNVCFMDGHAASLQNRLVNGAYTLKHLVGVEFVRYRQDE